MLAKPGGVAPVQAPGLIPAGERVNKKLVVALALTIGLTVAVPIAIASGTSPSLKVLYPLGIVLLDVIFLGLPVALYWSGRYGLTMLAALIAGTGGLLLLYTVYIVPGALLLTIAAFVQWARGLSGGVPLR